MNDMTYITRAEAAHYRIESAWHEYPFCTDCGRQMSIVERGGSLWMECVSLREMTRLRRFLTGAYHDSHDLEISVSPTVALAA
jgi:hypothetical protein